MYVAKLSSSCLVGTTKFQLQSLGRWKHQIQRGSIQKLQWYTADWAKHVLNYEQLQNHTADKRTTAVLEILLPIEVIFLTKSRVSRLQDWAPHMTCLGLNPSPLRARNNVWVFMDPVICISPWTETCHGSNIFSFTENFVAQIWTIMEISSHFYYSHHLTKMAS